MANQMRQRSRMPYYPTENPWKRAHVRRRKASDQHQVDKMICIFISRESQGAETRNHLFFLCFVQLISNFTVLLVFMTTHWMDITCIVYKDQLMWPRRWTSDDEEHSISQQEWDSYNSQPNPAVDVALTHHCCVGAMSLVPLGAPGGT